MLENLNLFSAIVIMSLAGSAFGAVRYVVDAYCANREKERILTLQLEELSSKEKIELAHIKADRQENTSTQEGRNENNVQ